MAASRSANLTSDIASFSVYRWGCLLRGHVDAAGAYRRLLWRSWLRPRPWRRDAVDDARFWNYQPHCLRLYCRPHRRSANATARLGAARCRFVSLPLVRWAHFSLCDLGVVRLVPGRHCPELRYYRPRIFLAARSRHSPWPSLDGDIARHGARRLVIGLDF